MAEKAVGLAPRNPLYRNTLGVAYYRAGRYRDTIRTLEPHLERQRDQFLAWDLYFLAMSYHRVGENTRANEYRHWATRWSHSRKDLSRDLVRELSAIQEEVATVFGTTR